MIDCLNKKYGLKIKIKKVRKDQKVKKKKKRPNNAIYLILIKQHGGETNFDTLITVRLIFLVRKKTNQGQGKAKKARYTQYGLIRNTTKSHQCCFLFLGGQHLLFQKFHQCCLLNFSKKKMFIQKNVDNSLFHNRDLKISQFFNFMFY